MDLHGEVCQLRSESRKLREANHRLNEENHWLQEELWDMRRQHERLLRTILNGTTDSTERGRTNNTLKHVFLYKILLKPNAPASLCKLYL